MFIFIKTKKRLVSVFQTHTEVGTLPISKLIIAQKVEKVKREQERER